MQSKQDPLIVSKDPNFQIKNIKINMQNLNKSVSWDPTKYITSQMILEQEMEKMNTQYKEKILNTHYQAIIENDYDKLTIEKF